MYICMFIIVVEAAHQVGAYCGVGCGFRRRQFTEELETKKQTGCWANEIQICTLRYCSVCVSVYECLPALPEQY